MMLKSYEQLLKEARSKLPESVLKESRLEIPEADVMMIGNKTIIKNFGDIADIIKRDYKHFAKFLFKELATPGVIDGKRLILQTKLQKSIIQKKIDDYIQEFVICKVCKKPDTRLIKEHGVVFMKCDACGAREPVRMIK